MEKNKKNRFKLGNLFYNDRFVLIFSAAAAVFLWFFMTATSTESDTAVTVSDVPIQVSLSESAQADGLRIVSIDHETANVSVRGSSTILGQVTRDDISISADTAGTINSPGNYPLPLTATRSRSSLRTDFRIVDFTPQTVVVQVERYRSKEFEIQVDSNYTIEEDYITTAAPNVTPESVIITGPESVLSNIDRVEAYYPTIEGALRASTTVEAQLVLYDAYGQELSEANRKLLHISVDGEENSAEIETVQVEITVQKRATLPLSLTYVNRPVGLSVSDYVTISPEEIKISGPEDVVSELTQIDLDELDFSQVSLTKNQFEMRINLPTGCKSLDNITTATVTVDTSTMTSRTFTVTEFDIKNNSQARAVTQELRVTIIGPPDQLQELTDEDITAVIDMQDQQDFSGHLEMPVTVSIAGATACWVSGEYTASVELDKGTSSSSQ